MNLEFSYSMDLPIPEIRERHSEEIKSDDENKPDNYMLFSQEDLHHDPFDEAEIYHKIKHIDNEYELSFYRKKT